MPVLQHNPDGVKPAQPVGFLGKLKASVKRPRRESDNKKKEEEVRLNAYFSWLFHALCSTAVSQLLGLND